jgi:hypothetical protein
VFNLVQIFVPDFLECPLRNLKSEDGIFFQIKGGWQKEKIRSTKFYFLYRDENQKRFGSTNFRIEKYQKII